MHIHTHVHIRRSLGAALVAGIALLVGACQAPAPRQFDTREVSAAGNLAIQHGQDMKTLGQRMVDHGQTLEDPVWVADGQHWMSDGDNLIAIGQQTVRMGLALKGDPVRATEVDIYQVRAEGQGIVANGQALVEHGKVMVELTQLLQRQLDRAPDPRLTQDVADSTASAQHMADTGQQLIKSGQQLIDFSDGMLRSIGR